MYKIIFFIVLFYFLLRTPNKKSQGKKYVLATMASSNFWGWRAPYPTIWGTMFE